ncbi:MAG: CDP-diacylglycerol--glycerol-3-phosphate 3-phosphatidyltransferase [Candidatus Competibacterales bacterium]
MGSLPLWLTLARLGLIPVLVAVFYGAGPGGGRWGALILASAAITDWLDGHLARRWGQTTAFGAFLDPVADKLLVCTALVLLVQAQATPAMAVACSALIGREILVSALREWVATAVPGATLAVSWGGKLKATLQFAALVLLFYGHPSLPSLVVFGQVLLWGAVAIAWLSLGHYVHRARGLLTVRAKASQAVKKPPDTSLSKR